MGSLPVYTRTMETNSKSSPKIFTVVAPWSSTRTFNARTFTWHQGIGTCELSALTAFGIGTVVGRLFTDATDLGLELRSPRTGVTKRFVLEAENKDREGEVTSWNFLEVVGPRTPGSRIPTDALQLIILND